MKTIEKRFILLLFVFALTCSCETDNDDLNEHDDEMEDVIKTVYGNGVTDIDGNKYLTVIIGDQEWMAENLRTTTYRNGTPINNLVTNYDWIYDNEGGYVWYDHDSGWKTQYGALYNWFAVANPAGLCPAGWRVPTDDDWTSLTDYLISGYQQIELSYEADFLKSCRQEGSPLGGECDTSIHPRWSLPSYANYYGTDDFGFSALPAGIRRYGFADFIGLGTDTYWWSSTEASATRAIPRRMQGISGRLLGADERAEKNTGASVRCIRN